MKIKKGFTLVELLLGIALISIVLLITTNLILFSMKGHSSTATEFDLQSNLRIASQKIGAVIRDASGVFILHREDADNLTEGWNYIMLNNEKTKLIEYVWDGVAKTHKPKEVFGGLNSVTLNLEFKKNNISNESKLLEFDLDVTTKGVNRNIKTELEAKNSLQVIDRSYSNIGNSIAYRYDSRLDEASNAQAVISMILDKSGSMGANMDNDTDRWGNYINVDDTQDSNPAKHSRMKKLRDEANRLITELAKKPNINISIIPFDSTANNPLEMVNAKDASLKTKIDSLVASGGTNTGDGMRRGYYQIQEFNEEDDNKTKTNKNFMIILVDGVTTFASVHENINLQITFSRNQGDFVIRDGKRYEYDRRSWFFGWTYYYVYRDTIYVDGNNNLNDGEINDYNVNHSSGGYAGNGSSLDPLGTAYVNKIGEMIKKYKEGTNEAIKVYVIGFSAVEADFGSLKDIALATRGDEVFYTAGDSKALEDIFKAIQRDITDALWHIGGPN